MSGDRSGYWGAVFCRATAHWWVIGEGKNKSLCGRDSLPIDIVPEWGRPRCKRCVKALIAMQEREDERRSLRTMTEADFREAHG